MVERGSAAALAEVEKRCSQAMAERRRVVREKKARQIAVVVEKLKRVRMPFVSATRLESLLREKAVLEHLRRDKQFLAARNELIEAHARVGSPRRIAEIARSRSTQTVRRHSTSRLGGLRVRG